MLVLGISGGFSQQGTELIPNINETYFHDAAACLIKDGELVAAVEEERFNRVKKTTNFPTNAVRACLDIVGVSPFALDAVGYFGYELAVDILLKNIYSASPHVPIRGSRELLSARLREAFGCELPDERLMYIPHHICHAMSSFVRSGAKDALVVVMDGWGEGHSISIFHGTSGQFRGARSQLESLSVYDWGKSLGAFYLQKIALLGYSLGDEYKVMGLAPYGNPDTYRDIFDKTYVLKDNGDFDIRQENLTLLLGGVLPRRKNEEFTQPHKDLAAGIQSTLEKIVMHVIGYWAKRTGLRNLCFVGGVAQNSSLNGLIVRSGTFDSVFVHPASHDGGTPEGAALAASLQLGAPPFSQPRLRCASLGPALGTETEIEKELASWCGLVEYERSADIVAKTVALLADGAVLGWAHGRSEFGPRALGNRSILADARPAGNKERINAMVKKRESYRPFAPVVTREAARDYFDIPGATANYDFMSFVVGVREDRRAELGAVTHVDGTARIQVIDRTSNERFYDLVRGFGEVTGVPVLLNTSFNNNAEPIVQSVHDALTCFLTTELDYLVIEDFLIRRRPGRSLALDDLVLQFRPFTHLARSVSVTADGQRSVVHEIWLQYVNGPRTEVSPPAYALLDAADGKRTVESLVAEAGGLDDALRRELYTLWQSRYFILRPA
jgi:predicted NodU family carbamoyl transferase